MELDKLKLSAGQLELGMYVSELDRPWLETPFLLQGFVISSEEELQQLTDLCDFVYIDVKKGSRPASGTPAPAKSTQRSWTDAEPVVYRQSTSRQGELGTADGIRTNIQKAYQEQFKEALHRKQLDIDGLREAVSPMVDSVLRNPDAFMLLTKLREVDDYAYNHAMTCSVLAVALARHIGLPRETMEDLSLGALLFDIGRARLPRPLLNSPRRLTAQEMPLVRRHLDMSLEIVEQSPGVTPEVLAMVATHHERHDGSGYPHGLKGEEIPLFGRIAGLMDCYDAVTSRRPFAEPLSPSEALRNLYAWRDVEFQGALVEQFIQVIGTYPLGTIVELTDGRIGVVVAQHREARMRPVVMLLMDRDKEFLEEFEEIDLRLKVTGNDGAPLHIANSLPRGVHGIDPAEYFL